MSPIHGIITAEQKLLCECHSDTLIAVDYTSGQMML